jgi:hypothetical protein
MKSRRERNRQHAAVADGQRSSALRTPPIAPLPRFADITPHCADNQPICGRRGREALLSTSLSEKITLHDRAENLG